MTTESLIIELDAKTKKLDTALKSTQKKLDELDGSTKKADKSFAKLTSVAKATAKGVAVVATAAFALSSALGVMAVNTAKARKEQAIFAKQLKVTVDEFQEIAFAMESAGVSGEQFADISKDISDRLGEFAAAGTGTFQDFADVVGLTKEETQKLAVEWRNLSSTEVLGNIVRMMEDAGVSGNKMTFVMESLGNESSRLTDLFKNNSKELNEQRERFKELRGEMALTTKNQEDLEELNTTFREMTTSIGIATDKISAELAPIFSGFFNSVIEIVPLATQAIIDFKDSFTATADITQTDKALKRINKLTEERLDIQTQLDIVLRRMDDAQRRGFFVQSDIDMANVLIGRVDALNDSIDEARVKSAELEASAPATLDKVLTGTDTTSGSADAADAAAKALEAIDERFKSEIQLLEEKLQRELELNDSAAASDEERLIRKAELLQEHEDIIAEIENEAIERKEELLERQFGIEQQLADLKTKLAKEEEKREKASAKFLSNVRKANVNEALNLAGQLASGSEKASKALFIVSKGLAIAETFNSTQAAVMRAFAELGPIAGAPVAASIETNGLIRVAAIAASTIGGLSGGSSGSISVGSGGGGRERQVEEEPETSTLELSERGTTSQDIVIRFETDTGDELLDALANGLNDRQRRGSL